MTKKYLLFSIEDDRAKKLAGILGNKTCKKIIDHLSETKEASENDIADALQAPINTVEYNLKKLLDAEIVEKTKNFFWSKKGKKIPMYKVSNKSIIISPKSKISSDLKSILSVAIFSGLGALIVRQYFLLKQVAVQKSDAVFNLAQESFSSTSEIARAGDTLLTMPTPAWIWFLVGALFAILIFSITQLVRQKASPLAASFIDVNKYKGGENNG